MTTYINSNSIKYVSETIAELEAAYKLRAQATRDSEEYQWSSANIEELHAELCSIIHLNEATGGF
ncbi:MAG TPA: hypothetical protein V6C89_21940 [Drouetiella sp.]